MSVSPKDPPGEDSPAPVEEQLRAAYAALRILGHELRTMRGDD